MASSTFSMGAPGGRSGGSGVGASLGLVSKSGGSASSFDAGEAARKEAARLRGRWLAVEDADEWTPGKADNPANWSVDRVGQWLETIGLEDKTGPIRKTFKDNDINGKALVSLSKEELQELGITSLGVKKTIMDAIAALPKQN